MDRRVLDEPREESYSPSTAVHIHFTAGVTARLPGASALTNIGGGLRLAGGDSRSGCTMQASGTSPNVPHSGDTKRSAPKA